MQIKAAVLREVGAKMPYAESKPLKIESLELDPPGPGELLVQVKAAGLCHSDLSVINGSRLRPTPMALGHEAAGIVKEVGIGVTRFSVGDHVVLVFVPSCGHCVPCAEGRPALCEPGAAANVAGTLVSGERRLHVDNGDVHHHLGVSAFADHAVVSETSCVKVDSSLSFEEAALFGCAVITGVGAVLNTAKVEPGSRVAVIGLGGVGLNSLLGAVVAGAKQIVAIDLREDKLALARQLGATDAVNASDENAIEAIRELTGGGVDYAFEMAGSVPALELAWAITARGGETITAGLPHPDKRMSLPPVQLVGEERTLKGSYLGSCVPVRDIPTYIDLYKNGKLPVDRLMSDRIALEDINAAFDRLAAGETVRQVIVFDS
ncbi:MAG: alcohol dehydrogenase catalytic domain-containing protein [Rhodospirillaceae bacterium]|jgi:alcohol dehydrogenase|nr:alcohol dehydrogenase catalytic domain-containing protein [Rhodospirillaceae bacterium]MBT5565890.1 alcohol dehydrogenase catalytic domain-containing protein [Rhodospirillaceae bacterium]MBT6088690.1 alcohol dehydrogenase catalytic domain-containing protein [Rhodospirillaceae bacterium]MBT6961002.1 alcohol dehydrogenase catalytic domain-containing protein [Rhodospirillaceae bacterium]